MYTQTDLVDGFGFTKAMIRDLLPAPTVRKTSTGWNVNLWPDAVVEDCIASDVFRDALAKAEVRRESARRAIATKRAKTEEEVRAKIAGIAVEHPEWLSGRSRMMREAVDHKRALDEAHGRNWYDNYETADDSTKLRWAVNYVRHELTTYDDDLYRMAGKVGIRDAYAMYKNAVLDAISGEYPYLADECERQKVRVEEVQP